MRKVFQKILIWIYPQLALLKSAEYDFSKLRSWQHHVKKGKNVRIGTVALLSDVEIGDYSYLSGNAIAAISSAVGGCIRSRASVLRRFSIPPRPGLPSAGRIRWMSIRT